MTLTQAYKKRLLLATGGIVNPNEETTDVAGNPIAKGIGSFAPIAAGLIDNFSNADPISGRKSMGSTIAKSALNGAAMGAQAGPIGAAVGAGVGILTGVLSGSKEKKLAREAIATESLEKQRMDQQQGAARIAADPTLVAGYKNAGYFAGGGELPVKPPTPIQAANQLAKSFAARRGFQNAEYTHVGNTLPAVTLNGKPVAYGSPLPTPPQPKYRAIPSDVHDFQYDARSNKAWWENDQGDLVEMSPNDMNRPQFKRKDIQSLAKFAHGGTVTAPLARLFMSGGSAKPLSSTAADLKGDSHKEGGIDIPELGAEVEGGETSSGNFIYSKKLGFADLHRPVAKAIGKIEDKPLTKERITTLRRLKGREQELANQQEAFKQSLNLQQ